MLIKLALIFSLILPNFVFGEGVLPVDIKNRTVTTGHLKLQVTESQELEMDTLHTLTLSSEQWQKLRKKGLMLPMRLDLVDYNEDTCACALMGFTAIRMAPKTVAILISETDAKSIINDSMDGRTVSMIIDRRGQFYANGVLIPYLDVLSFFADEIDKTDRERSPELSIWFPLDVHRDLPAVKERVNQLEDVATKSGWEVNVKTMTKTPVQED